jgi:RNA recognition motif-containing protein
MKKETTAPAAASSSLGYGFVTLASVDMAQKAMTSLQGTLLCGRPLRLRWAGRHIRDDSTKYEEELRDEHEGRSSSFSVANTAVYARFSAICNKNVSLVATRIVLLLFFLFDMMMHLSCIVILIIATTALVPHALGLLLLHHHLLLVAPLSFYSLLMIIGGAGRGKQRRRARLH